jgi:putative ABC transport system ATP-binding protein
LSADAVPITSSITEPDDAVIRVEGVGRVFETGRTTVPALRDVDLAVRYGEFVAVMGSSGSGKSTLMNLIGCLDSPTSGRYLLEGRDVAGLSPRERARVRNRGIGFVFQSFNLVARVPAVRNVELPLFYAGVGRRERRRRAMAALAAVGLADRATHRPTELSGGEQQRVAVARAVVTQPAIVLADEPTGNLDSVATHDVLRVLADLHDSGRTVLLITHEHDVAAWAERVVVLHDGRVVLDRRQTPVRTRATVPAWIRAGGPDAAAAATSAASAATREVGPP